MYTQCHTPSLDLKTARAAKLSGILVEEDTHNISDGPQVQKSLANATDFTLNDSFKTVSRDGHAESLYPHSKGDILLSSTAFDVSDTLQKEGAFPSGMYVGLFKNTLTIQILMAIP